MPPTLTNGKICYVEIPALDIGRSADFYAQVFGWNIRQRGDGQRAFDDTTGQVSGTWVTGRRAWSEPGLLFYVMVDSVAATIESVLAHGGELVQPIGADAPEITARFRDPGRECDRALSEPTAAEGIVMGASPIDNRVTIGHVHLKVADLDRALAFYCDVLGFELITRVSGAVFISAGGYHHHLALNTWHSLGGSPPPPQATGLYHVAILYPTRAALADALRRVTEAGIPIDGASDHGVSEALYLRDPDHNGIELYRDRPRGEWPRDAQGKLALVTKPLDVESLLKESVAGK